MHSVEQLANTVASIAKELYDKETIIKKIPAEQETLLPGRLMSIEKAKEILNWQPEVILREGMKELMENAEEVLK